MESQSAYYVMEMWQSGNVGEYQIRAVKENAEHGFDNKSQAIGFLREGNFFKHHGATYTIMEVYKAVHPITKN